MAKTESASGLQKVSFMKSLGVLILAVAFLAGCGVGYDDGAWTDDGQLVAQGDRQAVMGDENPKDPDPQEKTEPSATSRPVVDLPQDPIPLWQQRPAVPPGPAPGTPGDPRLPPPPLPGR